MMNLQNSGAGGPLRPGPAPGRGGTAGHPILEQPRRYSGERLAARRSTIGAALLPFSSAAANGGERRGEAEDDSGRR